MGDTERNCVTITAMYRYVIVYVHEITCRRLPSITPPGYVVSLIWYCMMVALQADIIVRNVMKCCN